MSRRFRVGVSRDFLTEDGELAFKDIGLSVLQAVPEVETEFIGTFTPIARPEELAPYDAVMWQAPRVTRASLVGVEQLAAIGRFGVGYDSVDLDACTDADVICFIQTGAVNRSLAEAILTLMLALGHRLFTKDRLTREGRWGEKNRYNGSDLREKVIGTVGLGGIGGELCRLLQPFGPEAILAFDPYCLPERAAAAGARLVDLETLLRQSDLVTVNCPLTPETRGLIGARELGWMKPTAYLVNTARGGIVAETPLYEALTSGKLQGAALDVFEDEPVRPDNPLLRLDNVIVAPHAIAWTDELFRDIGRQCARGLLKVMCGEAPDHVVNPAVLERPGLQRKLAALRERFGS